MLQYPSECVIFAEDRLHLDNREQALLPLVCTIFAKDKQLYVLFAIYINFEADGN